MKWKPYPSYKPSGVEWLGDVPAHWDAKPLGYLARFRGGAMPDKSRPDFWDGDIPWVSPKDMKRPRLADAEDHVSDRALSGSALSMIPPGAVLIVVRGMILAHSFPVAVADGPVTINQDMKALVPGPDVDAEYLAQVLTGVADVLVALADESAHGTRKIESAVLSRFVLPLPPPDDQSALCHFLDRETARLDALVAKKRALVERLREKRTALISRTVTRGLPPEAARAAGLAPHPNLKPSGIPWLGAIPEHWDLAPLGYLVSFQGGATPDKSRADYWDGPIPWVSPKDMKRPRISESEDHISAEGLAGSPLAMVPTGSVLVVVRGMILAHSFPVALTAGPVTINQDMKALIPSRRLLAGFLFWSLAGSTRELVALADESAHGTRKIETPILAKVRVPLPPLTEQRAIAEYLDRETARIDRLVEKVEAAIERLQEYRQALITAAVTGKIDVRDEAPGPAAA